MKHFNKVIERAVQYVLLGFCLLAPTALFAQRQVRGTVVDQSDGKPMPGVVVYEEHRTANGTTTNSKGEFAISVPKSESVIVAQYIGYKEQKIKVGTQSAFDIRLEPSAESIEDVVVVGYGTQTRVSLTGAVDAVKADDLKNRSEPNAIGLLQGKMPGVTVIKKSSQPGNPGISIRVRGEGTLGNNEPLVLIDGVPGDINTVNPDDIENVSVLKDAATAAIYGVRASGGVILFTTKKGHKSESLKVSASGYYGIQTTTRNPEFLGSVDYMRLRNEARNNVGMSKLYSETDIQAVSEGTSKLYANSDWVKEIYKSTAPIQNYNVAMQGGGIAQPTTFHTVTSTKTV